MPLSTLLAVLIVGAATGFFGGLFGKGGSALATPVLAALGIPAIVAVASPLPATIPGTLLAARQYARRGHLDRRVLVWSVVVGVPATLAGALGTRWIEAEALVVATDLLVAGLGVSILIGAGRARSRSTGSSGSEDVAAESVRSSVVDVTDATSTPAPALAGDGSTDVDGGPRAAHLDGDAEVAAVAGRARVAGGDRGVAVLAPGVVGPATAPVEPGTRAVVAVALVVGLVAGLLANSGGFLLAPLYLVALRLPVRPALGTSLAVSAALALPGTVAHAAMGHIDWGLVLVFGVASVPLSAVGARTALRVAPERLEIVFGAVLVVLATVLLTWG